MLCDLNLVQVILDFAVGGITLRVIIAFLKQALHFNGIPAMLLTIVCCLLATAIFLLTTGNFSWICLVIVGFAVYSGSQVAYRVTKAPAHIV
jgi:hypothetical protein